MSYIWQSDNWPSPYIDRNKIQNTLTSLAEEEKRTVNAFSILKSENSIQFRANLIASGISASLEIENEQIDLDSVYSSVAKHLLIGNSSRDSSNPYSDNLVKMISDAFENKSPMTEKRLLDWQNLLFMNQAGLAKKVNIGFRQGPEYVIKNSGKTSEVIYEAVPPEKVEEEIKKLLAYINESDENNYIKAAVTSIRFVLIHPFEDGNGRISRALADYVLLKDSKETLPLVSLSVNILKNKKDYYRLIENVSSQSKNADITEYVLWFLNSVAKSYEDSRIQLSRTLSISNFIGQLDPSEFNSRELHMLFLLASGKFHGKITNEKWSKINKCSSAAAFRDLQHLLTQNFIIPSGDAGPKTGYYFNEAILN